MEDLLNPFLLHMEKMKLELKCPICLILFKQPLLLPCNHVICSQCLQKSMAYTLECPLCKLFFLSQDLKPILRIENMANIYKDMEAALNAYLSRMKSEADLSCRTADVEKPIGPDFLSPIGDRPLSSVIFPNVEIKRIDMAQKESRKNAKFDVDNSLGLESNNTRKNRSSVSPEKKIISQPDQMHLSDVTSSSPSRVQGKDIDMGMKRQKLNNDLFPRKCNNEYVKAGFVCAFCQSCYGSEFTGDMMHFLNGQTIEGKDIDSPNVLHVHERCADWAPRIYYTGDKIVNLDVEVSRASKIKCSVCGKKGAALGCFVESCKKSYHVPCSVNVDGCRWDIENYLVLCPLHASLTFPSEKVQTEDAKPVIDTHATPTADSFNEKCEVAVATSGSIVCCSALSAHERDMVNKFASLTGTKIAKKWDEGVTHIIASTNEKGACNRTFKVLMGILNGKWILNVDWIRRCIEAKSLLPEDAFEISCDVYGCCGGPKNGRIRFKEKTPKLFSGMDFYLSGHFESSYKHNLNDLVVTAGGKIIPHKEEIRSVKIGSGSIIVVYNADAGVLTVEHRLKEAKAIVDGMDAVVVGHTWILDSVAGCKLALFT